MTDREVAEEADKAEADAKTADEMLDARIKWNISRAFEEKQHICRHCQCAGRVRQADWLLGERRPL